MFPAFISYRFYALPFPTAKVGNGIILRRSTFLFFSLSLWARITGGSIVVEIPKTTHLAHCKYLPCHAIRVIKKNYGDLFFPNVA
jgi:hypothetical protein